MSLNETVHTPETAVAPRRGIDLRRQPVFVVGGLPAVSLMPRELRTAVRERAIRRYLVMGVATALVIAAVGTAGAAAIAGGAQTRLDRATEQSHTLSGQLGRFRDVQLLQNDIAIGTAAREVATSTEIDWQAQIAAIEGDMPAGYHVTSIQADGATILSGYGQGSSPLDQPRAATMQVSVDAPEITQLPRWLRLIRSIPAYADATASVLSNGTSGYTVQLVVHLSPKALVAAGKGTR